MRRSAITLILPTLAFLLILVIYPTVYLFYMMFQSFNPLLEIAPHFAGLRNFITFINDPEAIYATLIMLFLTAITIPAELGLGILLGMLLSFRYLHGRSILIPLFLIPMSTPAVIIGLNWKMIFFAEGPLNAFLRSIGIQPQPWLSAPFGNPLNTIFCLAILDIWQWTPFIALAVSSGIESVPMEIREAASLDGASEMQILRHIILPMIKSVIVIILLLRIIDSLKIFDIIYMLTYGGPGSVTTTLPFYIYKVGFTLTAARADLGYASFLAVILLLIASILVVMVLMRVLKIEKVIWE